MKQLYNIETAKSDSQTTFFTNQIVEAYISKGSESAKQLFDKYIKDNALESYPLSIVYLQNSIKNQLTMTLGLTEFPSWLIPQEISSLEVPMEDPVLSPLAERLSVIYRTNPDVVDRTIKCYQIQYKLSAEQIVLLQNMVRNVGNLRYDY